MDDLERSVSASRTDIQRWSAVPAVSQASEAVDTPAEASAKWSKVYRLFGASGESAQDEVFAAVVMYFFRNGCSPNGKYNKPIRTAGGVEVSSGEVVKITGRLEGEIRATLRGRLRDCCMFLRHNPAVAEDQEMAAKAEAAGVPRNKSWLLADWLPKECPYFVGDEAEVYQTLRANRVALSVQKRKQEASMPRVNAVLDTAPELQLSTHAQSSSYNSDLF